MPTWLHRRSNFARYKTVNSSIVPVTHPVFVQGHTTSRDDHLGHAADLHALEDVEVARVVVCFGGDRTRCVSIPDHNVGIGAHSDTALKHTESCCIGIVARDFHQ